MRAIAFDFPQIEAGTYIVRFQGTAARPPFKAGHNGHPANPEPRLGWRFLVIGPLGSPMIGKIIEQGTGITPHRKSKLLEVLVHFLGRPTEPREPFDPQTYVGRTYSLVWGANPRSETGGLHIVSLSPQE